MLRREGNHRRIIPEGGEDKLVPREQVAQGSGEEGRDEGCQGVSAGSVCPATSQPASSGSAWPLSAPVKDRRPKHTADPDLAPMKFGLDRGFSSVEGRSGPGGRVADIHTASLLPFQTKRGGKNSTCPRSSFQGG